MPDAPRLLIVAPAWVGDAVISHALVQLLRRLHPDAAIDALAPPWVAPVYARMAEVGEVITAPFAHGELGWAKRRALARVLRTRGYDRAYLLPNSLKSALVPWLAGIPVRTGYTGESRYGLVNDRRTLDERAHPRLVERFAALALTTGTALMLPLPDPVLSVDASGRAAVLARLGLPAPQRLTALCPGAEYGPAKRWPAASYAEVARARLAAGDAVWIFGSGKDAPIGEDNAAQAPGVHNLCGRTGLAEAIDLLALADRVVTNDSGLMHVAAAVGTRVVAIFGSSTPAYTPPLSPRATAVSLQLSCSPCFERTCPLGHTNCLNQLHPARILATIGTPESPR